MNDIFNTDVPMKTETPAFAKHVLPAVPSSEVYLEDCVKALKRFNDNHFDLAIVDPPYGIGFDRENPTMSAGVRKDGTKRKMASWSNPKEKGYTKKDWDKETPSEEYWKELMRVSKNQIVWGGNYFSDYLKPHGGWIVWEKGVPEGMSLSQAELAWNSCLNSVRIVKVLWAGYKKADNEDRFHPTQKPVRLYDWILMNFAKPNDLILDTHLGSGSSRIAAYKGGFNFVGFEIDAEYYEKQEKRFNDFKSQLRLF
jgi:site-specific DNA-methyltransferase (adenine-specific)